MSNLASKNRRVGLWVLTAMVAVGGIAAALAALTIGVRREHDQVMPIVKTSLTTGIVIAVVVAAGLWAINRFVLPKLDRMSSTSEPPSPGTPTA